LPSICNKPSKILVNKNDISINEIIKQLPSHIDNSSIYKKQDFVNIYQKRQINDKISKRSKFVDSFPIANENYNETKNSNNDIINNNENNIEDNDEVTELISKTVIIKITSLYYNIIKKEKKIINNKLI